MNGYFVFLHHSTSSLVWGRRSRPLCDIITPCSEPVWPRSAILWTLEPLRPVENLVDVCCRHARRFAAGFSAAGFEVLNEVVLNQVLVSFGDDATTRAVIDAIQRDGTCWCGATVWQDKTAMRISVSSWATTDSDVEKSLGAMIAIAQRLANSPA